MTLLTAEASTQPHETARNADGATSQPVSVIERGRRFYSLILTRFAPKGTGEAVAIKTDLSESTVSRAKADAENVCAVIAALGLKLVSEDSKCMSPGRYAYLNELEAKVIKHAAWLRDEDVE